MLSRLCRFSMVSSLSGIGLKPRTLTLRSMGTKSYRGLTGGQIVYESLRKHNVENVFLYSGGAVMPIVDAFYDGQIKYYINDLFYN